jgi:hypothetical protein
MSNNASWLLPELLITDLAKDSQTPANKASALAAKLSPYKFNN